MQGDTPNKQQIMPRTTTTNFYFQLTGDWTQVEIIHLSNDPAVGLGFGIVGGASTGVVIKTILQGSAADKVNSPEAVQISNLFRTRD